MALNLKELQSETAWIAELDPFWDLDLSNRVLWARFTSSIDEIPFQFREAVDVYCPEAVPCWCAIADATDQELEEGSEWRYIVMAH